MIVSSYNCSATICFIKIRIFLASHKDKRGRTELFRKIGSTPLFFASLGCIDKIPKWAPDRWKSGDSLLIYWFRLRFFRMSDNCWRSHNCLYSLKMSLYWLVVIFQNRCAIIQEREDVCSTEVLNCGRFTAPLL